MHAQQQLPRAAQAAATLGGSASYTACAGFEQPAQRACVRHMGHVAFVHCRCPVLCFVWLIDDTIAHQTQMHGDLWVAHENLSSLHCVHVLDSWVALCLRCLRAVLCSVWLISDVMSHQTQMHGTLCGSCA
jgi:hypothetical protein